MDLSYFDQVIDRRNTDCCKWDEVDLALGNTKCIHLGVADADFRSPECVNDAVRALADHGLYGYTNVFDGFYEAVQKWMLERHGVSVDREHIIFTPRINIALGLIVREFTKESDSVVLNSPYYPPLKEAAELNGRKVIGLPLKEAGDSYELDLAALEQQIDASTRIFVLVSPHNPTTRVWQRQEMAAVARFCIKHQMILFVDEIHSDLIKSGYRFTSALELFDDKADSENLTAVEKEQLARLLVVANAPAKTFNMPGAIMAYLITRSPELKQGFARQIQATGENNPNIFGNAMLKAAYNHGSEYVELLNQYIDQNEQYFIREFGRIFPQAVFKRREGTYLLWVDMRQCFKDEQALSDFCLNQAQVAFNMGSHFGEQFSNHIRVNLATPKATLAEVITRLEHVRK